MARHRSGNSFSPRFSLLNSSTEVMEYKMQLPREHMSLLEEEAQSSLSKMAKVMMVVRVAGRSNISAGASKGPLRTREKDEGSLSREIIEALQERPERDYYFEDRLRG